MDAESVASQLIVRSGLQFVAALVVSALTLNGQVDVRLESPAALKTYTDLQIELAEKLNRADARYLRRMKEIVVPLDWDLAETAYSPLPRQLWWAEVYPKFIVLDLTSQVFGGYEFGRLVRWGPVSTGRKGLPTPAGMFHLNWRSRSRISSENDAWLMEWYFNFHSRRGIAFHKYALPGRPASHACVRLLEVDARWLYDWGEGWTRDGMEIVQEGTPVWIFGQYDHSAPKPWLSPEHWRETVAVPPPPPLISESRFAAQEP
jgi:hypothetical protein